MVITLILSTMFFLTWLGNLSVTKSSLLPTKVFVPQNFVLKGTNKLLVLFLTRSRTTSLRKQPTFRDAITGFLTKWRLRNERRNSILTTRHYPDLSSASDRRKQISYAARPIRSTTQISKWCFISMEFLRPFLRRHFAGKRVVASQNVGCFLLSLRNLLVPSN